MNRTVKTVNQIELKWSPYWFLILVNSGFRNINLAANIPLLFTSCSRTLKCLSNVQHDAKYQSKQEKLFSTWFLVMSLRKILETFIRFFPSSFNRKYGHTVACTVDFVGPAHFVFNAYPGRNATCPLSSWSNKNDGSHGHFNCISTVSCKGSVCVEVLTSSYCRFFVEEGQFIKYTPSTSVSYTHLTLPTKRIV